jgi:hypothetical protein
VRVPVLPVQDRHRLVPAEEPPLHLLDLGLLREVHPLGEERQPRGCRALRHERGHPQRLGVVVDHPLHEEDVRFGVSRRLDLGELLG